MVKYLTGQPYDVPFRIIEDDEGRYTVLPNEYEADDFAVFVLGRPDAQRASCNGHQNAVLLQDGECEE